jgi:hypothetical protein
MRVVTARAVASRHQVAVSHGSGPQVGWLAMRASLAGGGLAGIGRLEDAAVILAGTRATAT